MNQKISLVVPCYNEQEVLPETIKRVNELCESLSKIYSVEQIYVNDGSRDETLNLLKEYQLHNRSIKIVSFSRNFGHQIAVTAGIDAASGDAVILLDADLQDPPEVILQMISKWQDGYDVVYGVRESRDGESVFKLTTARLFYRLLNKLSDVPIPLDTGDFRLMSRKVVNALVAMPEKDRFIRGMVSWVGFKQISLPYKRSARFAGESKYPLTKMIKFALDGILSFSNKPLQISAYIGLICKNRTYLNTNFRNT